MIKKHYEGGITFYSIMTVMLSNINHRLNTVVVMNSRFTFLCRFVNLFLLVMHIPIVIYLVLSIHSCYRPMFVWAIEVYPVHCLP